MASPSTGDTVTIDFVLRRTDGEVIGGTAESGPQLVTLGDGQLFPQIEDALGRMALGETRTIAVPCAEAFGPRSDKLVMDIPRAELPPGPDPQPGMAMQADTADGQPITLFIIEVSDKTVKVDANHPLAGEDLSFEVTLRSIVQAL